MRDRRASGFAFAVLLAATPWAAPVGAADPSPTTAEAAPAEGQGQPSLTEINKKLTNPVSDLWSITFQQNNFRLDPGQGHGQRWSSNLLFSPCCPWRSARTGTSSPGR